MSSSAVAGVLVVEREVASAARDKIQTVVFQDAIEPGIERPLLVEARARLVGLDEGFLG
jgi:hypothetical protein